MLIFIKSFASAKYLDEKKPSLAGFLDPQRDFILNSAWF